MDELAHAAIVGAVRGALEAAGLLPLPDPDEAVVHENGDELGARGDLQPGP